MSLDVRPWREQVWQAALRGPFADASKLKVLHAMQGLDVPILRRELGVTVVGALDTQVCARCAAKQRPKFSNDASTRVRGGLVCLGHARTRDTR